ALNYFATVLLPGATDHRCSIFLSPFRELLDASGNWQPAGLVLPIIHEVSPRVGRWEETMEPSSEHGLRVGSQVVDQYTTPDGEPSLLEGSKMGGRPYFVRSGHAMETYAELRVEGFWQLVQFDRFGLKGAGVQGNWPFGQGVFSLLARK